jgi:hypothetical protein
MNERGRSTPSRAALVMSSSSPSSRHTIGSCGYRFGMPAPAPLQEVTVGLEKVAQQVVEEVRADNPRRAAVQVDVLPLVGSPAEVLLEQSRDADLLVLGHRGRGGFTDMPALIRLIEAGAITVDAQIGTRVPGCNGDILIGVEVLAPIQTHRRLSRPSFYYSTYTTALQKVLKFLLDWSGLFNHKSCTAATQKRPGHSRPFFTQ